MYDAVIAEIDDIRTRLGEIAEEREHLPDDSDSHGKELLEEEHRLEARLTELEDQVADSEKGGAEEEAATHTDLTRSPKLPENPEE
jgi:uncharacterized protein (DUF3084 family)